MIKILRCAQDDTVGLAIGLLGAQEDAGEFHLGGKVDIEVVFFTLEVFRVVFSAQNGI